MKFYIRILLLGLACVSLSSPLMAIEMRENIYSSYNLTIDVVIKMRDDVYSDPNRKIKYEYIYTGKYNGNESYLNWTMLVTSCNGDRQRIHFSLPTKTMNTNGQDLTIQEMDFFFRAQNIVTAVEVGSAIFSNTADRSVETLQGLKSRAASYIKGPKVLRYGQTADFEVVGGALGLGATWVWSKAGCGKRGMMEGPRQRLSPNDAGTYYVYATNKKNDTTGCIMFTFTFDPTTIAPSGINGANVFCPNETQEYSISGGELGERSEWTWYVGNKKIATGEDVRF